jgi:BirA family biotin operon repressor/biotin-[acetyl-CoA-carboxylase] ligase
MSIPVALPPGWALVAMEGTDSTNDEAKRRAGQGAAEGTVIWAVEQSRGRGRRGREWISPPGNLYCSVLLRPDCAPSDAPQAAFVAALATAEALDTFLEGERSPSLKWPNDVLVRDRKIAGILLESATSAGAVNAVSLDWMVAGIGVNVAHHPEQVMYPATSLGAEGAGDVPLELLLEALLGRLFAWLQRWREAGFGPVREAWMARAARIGQTIGVQIEGDVIDGIFRGLDTDGALLMDTGGTLRRVSAGDVFFA